MAQYHKMNPPATIRTHPETVPTWAASGRIARNTRSRPTARARVKVITTRLIPKPYAMKTESDPMSELLAIAPAMRLRKMGRVQEREATP